MKWRKRFILVGGLILAAILLTGCMAFFNHPPTASFTWTPETPYAGQVVRFDGSTSSDPDSCDEIIEYLWDFGDESDSQYGSRVEHTYQDDGTYSVSLSVKDKCGKKTTLVKKITVLNPPPQIIDFSKDMVEAGDRVMFCVKAFDPAAIGLNSIAQVKWEFGDGSAPQYGSCVEHCYSQAGRFYVVRVTVTDDDRATASFQTEVYVYPKDCPPTAAFSINPNEVHLNDIISLDASSSHDNDRCYVPCDCCRDCAENSLEPSCHSCRPICNGRSRIVSYKWTIWPPAGTAIVLWGSRVDFRAEQTGSYRVKLEVKDDEENWVSTSKTIEVQP